MMNNQCLRERCQAETATLLQRQGVIALENKFNMEVRIKGKICKPLEYEPHQDAHNRAAVVQPKKSEQPPNA